METLDEFDEYPLSVSFCKLISLEEFEEQSLPTPSNACVNCTQDMEQSPRICKRALRNQKQMEKEAVGLIPYLKAKIFRVLQRDLNYCNSMGVAEMKDKVLQLRQDMQIANNYAHAAKTGRGQHRKKHALQDRLNQLHSKVPEPPKFTMPRFFGPFPEVMNKQGERASTSSPYLKYWWTGLKTVSQKRPPGNAPTPQSSGSTGTQPAAPVSNTSTSWKFQGDTEEDTDSE
ncbi:uncharacterized protein LOC134170112 [Pezoporus occidentalis]|uniref:uncharacterized protein LOC134170112 n=1 Tax=Pezoporus occidentalis TaxID=407982 RepID=UPI002F9080CF